MRERAGTITEAQRLAVERSRQVVAYQAAVTAILDRVKVGDKVKFAAEKINGTLTVTNLEIMEH